MSSKVLSTTLGAKEIFDRSSTNLIIKIFSFPNKQMETETVSLFFIDTSRKPNVLKDFEWDGIVFYDENLSPEKKEKVINILKSVKK